MDNSNGALACWMHLIVFDLIIAYYIRTQGAEMGLSHWWLLPCLLLGPFGLLLFLIMGVFI